MVRHHGCPTHRKIDLRGAGFVTVNGQGEITEERTAVARAIVSGAAGSGSTSAVILCAPHFGCAAGPCGRKGEPAGPAVGID